MQASGQCLPAHPLSPVLTMGEEGEEGSGWGALYTLFISVCAARGLLYTTSALYESVVRFWEMFLLFPGIFNDLYYIVIALGVDNYASRMSCRFFGIYCQP